MTPLFYPWGCRMLGDVRCNGPRELLGVSKEYTFRGPIDVTRTIAREFNAVEQRPWTIEAAMIELMKQVGDLVVRALEEK